VIYVLVLHAAAALSLGLTPAARHGARRVGLLDANDWSSSSWS